MGAPLVSVICLCYNHASYIEEAVNSVFNQVHTHIELIIVDDASTDGSKMVIQKILKENPNVTFIDLTENHGNCKAFNKGLSKSKGDYIIDLAADDILLPNRVSEGLKTFEKHNIGVEFCDVLHVDKSGSELKGQFKRSTGGELIERVPTGDIYQELIERYFISPPGMMMKREVLEKLGGYDESLSYEDFDFWIRSARHFEYGFTDQLLVKKRDLKSSLSKKQFTFRSKHQLSTIKVCQKILKLNETPSEYQALSRRCLYEMRQCIKQLNLELLFPLLKVYFKAKQNIPPRRGNS